LHLRSGEAFDDPALVLLFVHHDLLLQQVDHDVVVHYPLGRKLTVSVVLQTLSYRLPLLRLLAHFLSEQVSNGDAFPGEVFMESKCDLLSAAAGWSHEEDAFG
jgi:hypothetical protein